ncbi:hypothetical protein MtrunA17_Chr7g0228651 [Medicago truncatula]|uniref:Uncharacterized protein n=1 Tax=Medicago truncatula TaxID=3880 RepID=A2Q2G4_MEDTR|nr:hypothetical protein MtrDRAFT_AC150800g7v2 [Medicago truncatula]RHN45272.1 hypothetical protein MtrunA17_Chr7g0228651 [Medicago truncatula]
MSKLLLSYKPVEVPNKVPEPAEVFKSQDVQLEAEINANIDEEAHKSITKDNETDSTQGSFVDATVDNNDNLSTNEEVTSAQNDISTPERVAKDMEFLQQS